MLELRHWITEDFIKILGRRANMKNFIQPGKVLTFKNHQTKRSSGDLVIIGDTVGVAVTDCEVGDDLVLDCEGVYSFPKVKTDVITDGKKLAFNAGKLTIDYTKGPVVATATDGVAAGTEIVIARLLQTILPKAT